jgi:glycosyltransferase involved in cell wall biosynthesis
MRILHFMPVYAPAWQYGGPVLSVSRLCEGLARLNLDVRVLTTNAGLPELPLEQLGKPLFRHGVQVTYHPVDRNSGTIRSAALERALPAALDGVDLVHLSAIWQPLGLAVQRSALQRGIPVLHSLRGALGPYSFRRGWWKKIPWYLLREYPLLQRAAGLHVTSRQEERDLRGRGLTAPRWLLPNPLDLSHLGVDPLLGTRSRRQLGLDPTGPVLLVCGRLHHKKGLDLLPQVLAGLASQNWQLLVVGSDDDGSGAQLRAGLERHGLGGRLRWFPTQAPTDLGAIYNAADLLLVPSRHENFGNVVVEALACGTAVLVSDRTGIGGDLIAEAPPGFGAVLPRQLGLWSSWLAGWLQQPNRATPAAAAWAAERYDQATVAQQAKRIYSEILQTWPTRAPRP